MTTFATRSRALRQQTGTKVAIAGAASAGSVSTIVPGYPADVTVVVVVPVTESIVASDGYTVYRELYRCTIDNEILEDISDQFIDGAVDLNLDRAIKLGATFSIRNPSNVIPFSDFLAPYVRFVYDDGRADLVMQCGLFATKVPPATLTENDEVATYEGADLTSVMATSYLVDTINRGAGQNYVTAGIVPAITGIGTTRYNIPATTATFPVIQTYPIGMSFLERANLVCDQLGWYHLGADLDGRISTPGAPQTLSSIEPWRTLTNDDLINGMVQVQPSGQDIANVVLVINEDAAAAPLSSIARNDDPSSPTSTVGPADGGMGIGREIMRLVKVQGSTTQAALDALAARYLAESRTYYRIARATILHDPTALQMHQVVQLTLSGRQESLSGKWRVRTASMGFSHNRPTVLELNQVTDDLTEAVI